MILVASIILAWLSLCSAQQMCVYQEHWTEPKSIVTFDSYSTLHTSTVEKSLVDVSNASITGDIHIDPYNSIGRKGTFHLQVKVTFNGIDRTMASVPAAEVYLQKQGKVTLIDSYAMVAIGGFREYQSSVVGLRGDKKLGYLLLHEDHLIEEFHEAGFLKSGDNIRLVTGTLSGGSNSYLDISMCIFYDDWK